MGQLFWKRVYDGVAPTDGFGILIDRLWPRGVSKASARLDYWARNIAPTAELRSAYHKNEIDYRAFAEQYGKELHDNDEMTEFTQKIKNKLEEGNVTLLYASREPAASHIPVLRSFIEKRLTK